MRVADPAQSDAISLLHRLEGVLIVASLDSSRGDESKGCELRSRLAAPEAPLVGVIGVGGGKRAGGYVAAGRSAPTVKNGRTVGPRRNLPRLTPQR